MELCKFLLALDIDNDPLGALLMIDYYAVKAGEGAWLKALWTEWAGEDGESAAGLPNFAYSIALSSYEAEVNKDKVNKTAENKKTPTLVVLFNLILFLKNRRRFLKALDFSPRPSYNTQVLYH